MRYMGAQRKTTRMAVRAKALATARKTRPDFLDEIIAESTKRDSQFRSRIAAAERRRRMLQRLVQMRERSEFRQKDVAERMGTSQAEVSRIESGEIDLRSSTIERYALALGHDLHYSLVRVRAKAG